MPKLKRKGKTFVTEHYIDQSALDDITSVIGEVIVYKRSKDKHGTFLRSLELLDEISLWADPRGVFWTYGQSLPKTPIAWNNLNVSRDTIQRILMCMKDAYDEHGQDCPPSYHFKIILNEQTLQKITLIFQL